MSGLEILDELADAFRKLETFPQDAAKIAAPLVDAALKETARAGTDPLGNPWPPKKDGGAPLKNAADHITTKAVGTVVQATLQGVEVFHHYGAGVPRRQILPDPGTIPPRVEKALRKAADQAFDKATR